MLQSIRRTFSFALCLLTAAALPQTASADGSSILPGDYDGSGTVDILDAQSVLLLYADRLAGNPIPQAADQCKAADVTRDDSIDAEDAQYILQYYTICAVSAKRITWQQLLYPELQVLGNGELRYQDTTLHNLTFRTINHEKMPKTGMPEVFWLDVSKKGDFVFDGELLELDIEVKSDTPDGIYPVEIEFTDFSNYSANTDANAKKLNNIKTVTGYVSVNQPEQPAPESSGDMTLTLDSVSAKSGMHAKMCLFIDNNPGICAFRMQFSYDEKALQITGCEAGTDFAKAAQFTTLPNTYF